MFPEITSMTWRSLFAAGPAPLSILRVPGEEKTVTSFEAITTDWYARNGYNQIYEALGGSGASWSGERVNLASALNHSVVWACNRIIAETVGFIPLVMLQVDKNTAKGKQPATKHPDVSGASECAQRRHDRDGLSRDAYQPLRFAGERLRADHPA